MPFEPYITLFLRTHLSVHKGDSAPLQELIEEFEKFLRPCVPPEIQCYIGIPRKRQKEFREFLMDRYHLLMDNCSQRTWRIRGWHLHDRVWQDWQKTRFEIQEKRQTSELELTPVFYSMILV
jgi:hypothetical protein